MPWPSPRRIVLRTWFCVDPTWSSRKSHAEKVHQSICVASSNLLWPQHHAAGYSIPYLHFKAGLPYIAWSSRRAIFCFVWVHVRTYTYVDTCTWVYQYFKHGILSRCPGCTVPGSRGQDARTCMHGHDIAPDDRMYRYTCTIRVT